MVTTNIRNGVDVDRLVATVGLIQADPHLAQFQFRSQSRWDGGGRCVTEISSLYGAGDEQHHVQTHTLVGDEPDVLLGSDSGANAVETVLAALASCLAVGFAYNAAARGITIQELTFNIEGDLDLHAFLGLSDERRAGFERIRVSYNARSSADDATMAELEEHVLRTSPVLDIVRNPVPVTVRREG